MIFYADDDLDDLEFFTDVATSLGRKVLTFPYADDLMHQLKNPPPCAGIIFLDINMPKKSGFDILNEIRSAEQWKDLPVVMFTTSDSEQSISKAKSLGANLYIRKSPNIAKLAQSIKHALSINWKVFTPTETEFVYI